LVSWQHGTAGILQNIGSDYSSTNRKRREIEAHQW
jgi:hypothetical protein